MIRVDTSYFQCPNCASWLEGKQLRTETVNLSILYSDGKTLNDNYIIEPQKLIVCPACGHWHWVESLDNLTLTKDKPAAFYSWNTWRFYGVHFASNEGKAALVSHYHHFLKTFPDIENNPEKEIYLRRMLWWAYNDFIRERYQMSLKYLFSGNMSFNVWRKNRRRLKEGFRFIRQSQEEYDANLSRLFVLLESQLNPDDERFEAISLEMIEILRELKRFDEAQRRLDAVPRRTHYISNIERHVQQHDPFVFLVTG